MFSRALLFGFEAGHGVSVGIWGFLEFDLDLWEFCGVEDAVDDS